MATALVIVIPALVVLGGVLCLSPLAPRFGLFHRPEPFGMERAQVPVVGGVAMVLGFLSTILLPGVFQAGLAWIYGPLLLLLLLGLWDDARNLRYRYKLVGQAAAALMAIVLGGHTMNEFGIFTLPDTLLGNSLATALTVAVVVGVVNAANFSDGLDGLAGGLALVALVALIVLAQKQGATIEANLLIAAAAGLLVFLYFNVRFPWRSGALVFMGDAGSMFLGGLLTMFFLLLSQAERPAITAPGFACVYALPVFDVIYSTVRRMQSGNSPFVRDRSHMHHLLVRAGWSEGVAVVMHWGAAALLAALGVWAELRGLSPWAIVAGLSVALAAYHFVYRALVRAASNAQC